MAGSGAWVNLITNSAVHNFHPNDLISENVWLQYAFRCVCAVRRSCSPHLGWRRAPFPFPSLTENLDELCLLFRALIIRSSSCVRFIRFSSGVLLSYGNGFGLCRKGVQVIFILDLHLHRFLKQILFRKTQTFLDPSELFVSRYFHVLSISKQKEK